MIGHTVFINYFLRAYLNDFYPGLKIIILSCWGTRMRRRGGRTKGRAWRSLNYSACWKNRKKGSIRSFGFGRYLWEWGRVYVYNIYLTERILEFWTSKIGRAVPEGSIGTGIKVWAPSFLLHIIITSVIIIEVSVATVIGVCSKSRKWSRPKSWGMG